MVEPKNIDRRVHPKIRPPKSARSDHNRSIANMTKKPISASRATIHLQIDLFNQTSINHSFRDATAKAKTPPL